MDPPTASHSKLNYLPWSGHCTWSFLQPAIPPAAQAKLSHLLCSWFAATASHSPRQLRWLWLHLWKTCFSIARLSIALKLLPVLKAVPGSWGRSVTHGEAKQPSHCCAHGNPWSLCQSKCSLETLYPCPCCGISPALYFLWLELLWSCGHSLVADALTQTWLDGNPKVFEPSWRVQSPCSYSYGQSQVQGGLRDVWVCHRLWNLPLLGC